MIPKQTVTIPLSSRNRTHFRRLGYSTGGKPHGAPIKVAVAHLLPQSSARVRYVCDGCGVSHTTFYFTLSQKPVHLCGSCSRRGKSPSNKMEFSGAEVDLVEHLYVAEWLTPQAIAATLGCSHPVVRRLLRERGHPVHRRGKKPNMVCPACGRVFRRSPAAIRETNWCSKACRGISSRLTVETKCEQCGRVFDVKPHQIRRRFCSPECANAWQSCGMIVACETCGQPVRSIPSRPRLYCSHQCRATAQKTGVYLRCANCGAFRYSPRSHVRQDVPFCSTGCATEFRKHNDAYGSEIAAKIRAAHRGLWSDEEWAEPRRRELARRALETQEAGLYRRSQLELRVHDMLRSSRLSFEPWKRVTSERFATCKEYDIYFPETDAYVEIHGSYWHADPRFYGDASQLFPVQRHNLANDQIKAAIVQEELGRPLYVVWEHDVYAHPDKTLALLTHYATERGVNQ